MVKASINGPNRRRNRAGDKSIASDLDGLQVHVQGRDSNLTNSIHTEEVQETTIQFKIKPLEQFLATAEGKKLSSTLVGNSCVFSARRDDSDSMGKRLISKHLSMGECILYHNTM